MAQAFVKFSGEASGLIAKGEQAGCFLILSLVVLCCSRHEAANIWGQQNAGTAEGFAASSEKLHQMHGKLVGLAAGYERLEAETAEVPAFRLKAVTLSQAGGMARRNCRHADSLISMVDVAQGVDSTDDR